jgi:hypothetical protein
MGSRNEAVSKGDCLRSKIRPDEPRGDDESLCHSNRSLNRVSRGTLGNRVKRKEGKREREWSLGRLLVASARS